MNHWLILEKNSMFGPTLDSDQVGYYSRSKMAATERNIPISFTEKWTVHFIDSTSIIAVTKVIYFLYLYLLCFN